MDGCKENSDLENGVPSNTAARTKKDEIVFEDLLQLVGTHGTWQIGILILLIIQAAIAVIHIGSIEFSLNEPNHWCNIPELQEANWTRKQIQAAALPKNSDDSEKPSSCHMFKRNYSVLASDPDSKRPKEFIKPITDEPHTVVSCYNFLYDKDDDEESLVTEWNLVCESATLQENVRHVFSAGSIIGGFVGGFISDGYGRRTGILWVMVVWSISALMSGFVPSYEWYILFKFLNGFGAAGTYVCAYTLVMETVTPSVRASWATYYDLGANFGSFLLVGLAYTFRKWRYLHIVTSLPCIALYIVYWRKLPESPRWLITKGKLIEAEEVLKQAMEKNEKSSDRMQNILHDNTAVVHDQIVKRQRPCTEKTAWANFLNFISKLSQILRNKVFMYSVVVMSLNWLITSFINHGISDLAKSLNVGPFTISTLSAAMSLLVRLVMDYPLDHIGRKYTMCISFMLAGTSILGAGFVPPELPGVTIMLMLVSLVCSFALITAIYLLTVEIFPTEIRTTAVAFGSAWDNMGDIAAPFAVESMMSTYIYLPNIMVFIFTFILGILTLGLPETRRKHLTESIGDVENQKRWLQKNFEETTLGPEDLVTAGPSELQKEGETSVQTAV